MSKKHLGILIGLFLLVGIISFARGIVGNNKPTSTFGNTRENAEPTIAEKVYIALEADGKVAVFNTQTQKILTKIELENNNTHYMAHNVQVAPDGKSVWVTANAEGKHDTKESGSMNMDSTDDNSSQDEAIVIDPQTDTIIKRIPLAKEAHLAHVVVTPNNSYAYVTAQMGNTIYKINTTTYELAKRITTPKGSQPHGLRITPDGSKAFIAMMGGKAMGILDLKTDLFSQLPLEGAAVQTGVTKDGKYAFASVFDKRELALYEIASQKFSYIPLPIESKGPLQMYATPDSRYVYLADQGNYFNQPNSDKLYKIDLQDKKVIKTIIIGTAPHGVVISKDGKYVYVTNLVSDDMSIVDTATDKEIKRITVGKTPNGISIWSGKLGGTQ